MMILISNPTIFRNLIPVHSALDISGQMNTGGLNMTVKEE